MPSAAPVVLPSVSPEVRLPKADATWSAVMAAVAVKVKPLTVALWPAPKAENVSTDFSATAVLLGATANVAASLASEVYTAVALVVAAEA